MLVPDALQLRKRIVAVLVLVVSPIFALTTYLEWKTLGPSVEEEVRASGMALASSIALEVTGQLRHIEKNRPHLEARLSELAYLEPGVIRIDVFQTRNGSSVPFVSSTDEPRDALREESPPLTLSSHRIITDVGAPAWEIHAPVRSQGGGTWGSIRVILSLRTVGRLMDNVWQHAIGGTLATILLLIVAFNFFLKRTFDSEKRLAVSENRNQELSEKVRSLEQRLMQKDKLAALGELSAQFAHEVGSPLTAVSAHLQLLDRDFERGTAAPEKSHTRVRTIATQIARIESIITRFLEPARRTTEQKQLVDARSLVESTVAIIEPRARELGISLVLRLQSSPAFVRVVPIEMEQILLNLLNNALDATAGNTTRPKQISITNRADSGRFALEIQDSGAGIAASDREKVFEPFFTTKNAGQGTGLGLTICRNLAVKNGATLALDSTEGAGTVATLSIASEYRA